MSSEKIISTRSLWCSAFLLLRGHQLISFELITPRDGYFLFNRTEAVERDMSIYYTGSPEVPIQPYLNRYKELREIVMRAKKGAKPNGATST